MDGQALYDLAPLWRLLLVGAALATLPVAWVLWRNRGAGRRLQAFTVLTLFLTFDLVLFGAFTRLTDSGLGCPDWPGCYGQATPVGAASHISAAQSAMPTGPVTHGKAWIEMIHRYLATGVGALIVLLLASRWRVRRAVDSMGTSGVAWAAATLAWVCLQGAFGALTVTMKLFPAIVTLHMLGGLVLLALLTVQAVAGARPAPVPVGLHRLTWLVLVLLGLQVTLGGWVSTNYAVLACTDFPRCQGTWWPHMDFAQGFTVWRALGMTGDGQVLGFEALTAIHWVHRLVAVPAIAGLCILGWRAWREPMLRVPSRWLLGLAALQLVTGLSNVVLDWPLAAAVLHTGGAGALVVVLVWMLRLEHASRGEKSA